VRTASRSKSIDNGRKAKSRNLPRHDDASSGKAGFTAPLTQIGESYMEQMKLRLGYRLVAFLDVLGQRNCFKSLCLPKTPEESFLCRTQEAI